MAFNFTQTVCEESSFKMLDVFCIDKIRKMATIVKHVKSVELVEPKFDMNYPFDNSVKSYSFSGRSG